MNPAAPGPVVTDVENLYRGITTDDWWVSEENRPSSAAFKQPDFSVDIASLAGSVAHTISHLPVGSGVVAFNCGDARVIGFVTRLEPDPEQPQNHAHANVYNSEGSQSRRKKMAAKLIEKCVLIQQPDFDAMAAAKPDAS